MFTGFLVACKKQQGEPLSVRFTFDPPTVLAGTHSIRVQDLRFYVHDVELLHKSAEVSQWQALTLTQDNWQNDQVALLDLSSANRNAALRGRVGKATYSGIRFTVGVPFALNHGNVLTAQAPLNRGDLFWAWSSGYKFLRLDLNANEVAGDSRDWSFHLGSTGCSSASALRPPSGPCAQPNRMRVELLNFDPQQQTIALRLDAIVAAMTASEFKACTGDYQSKSCAAVYALTGLSADGECPGDICAAQSLFVVKP